MKIFNWVQRRFHNGALKDGLARNMKKAAESITNDADKQALLKQVALVDILDGWKDGILTIGTLGLDPIKPLNQLNEYSVLEEEEEDDDNEEELEEEHEQCSDDYDHDFDDDDDINVEVADQEQYPLLFTTFDHSFEDLGFKFEGNDGVDLGPIEIHSSTVPEDGKKKVGRITLAELFLADSDMKKKPDFDEVKAISGKKTFGRAKTGLSFAKKLLPHVGEDSRPMKKIHQLMRRMLKRKIHPELEGKGSKADNQNKSGGTIQAHFRKEKVAESVSLLQPTSGAPCAKYKL